MLPALQERRVALLRLTLVSRLLQLTAQTKHLRSTSSVHAHLLRTGLYFHADLQAKLFLSYAAATSGHLSDFRISNLIYPNDGDPSCWNVTLSDLSRQGFPFLVVRLFSSLHRHGVSSDSYTLCSALTATATIRNALTGKQIHGFACKSGWDSSLFVGGALIDLYVKTELIEYAKHMFDGMPYRNTICLNSLITGYSEMKAWDEGLELLRSMPSLGIDANEFTISLALRMCAELPSLELGMQVHGHFLRRFGTMEGDLFVQSSLVEMYGKSGLIEKARRVFDKAGVKATHHGQERDLILWTSMLNVYSRNNCFDNVIATFQEMLAQLIRPDDVAFVTVLSACSRMGYQTQGLEYFNLMWKHFGIIPRPEHYCCIMGMLCRAGELDKAWHFASVLAGDGSDVEMSSSVWCALLSACRECGNADLGRAAAEKAFELDSGNVGVYMELLNLYAVAGLWDEMEKLREAMKGINLKKDVAISRLDMG